MKKTAIQNSLVSFICQVIIVVLAMVIPRLVMINYGSDTNGLTNAVTQIYTYMALLAAGIGQATQNALYKYLSDEDRHGISRIMSIARRYYRKISVIYAVTVLIVSAILPFVFKTEVSGWVVSLYVIFGGATSLISFYFTSLWTVFLNANGKSYITNLISLLGKVLLYAVIIVLSLGKVNIAIIQIGCFLVALIPLAFYCFYMKRHYSWIDYRSADVNDILPDRKAYVITEVAWTVFSSSDMIILSIAVSTKMASVYATYNMIFVALETMLNGVYYSVKYLLGITYHDKREEYEKLHDTFNSVFVGSSVALLSVCYLLIIPFIKMYTRGVTDINYIWTWLPLGFCLVKLLSRSRMVAGNLTGIAGYAKQVSYVSLLEAVINIALSVILVGEFGLYGVLYATVISLLVKLIYVNYLADRKILNRKAFGTVILLSGNYIVFAVTVFLQYIKPIEVRSYLEFLLYGIGLMFIYAVVVFVMNIIVNKSFRGYVVKLMKKHSASRA